ncbi:putative glucan endo-1,3-beta-D-glucosidase [Martiniozyma asiatica (nom. inval.)]|nr:putative glucan endo-1,3-beta-D-glucosidase [Martiniozyma asiatica]
MLSFLYSLLFLAIANSLPVPVVITRVHTAAAVTTTTTQIFTVTTTIPVVEVIVGGPQPITTYYNTLTTIESNQLTNDQGKQIELTLTRTLETTAAAAVAATTTTTPVAATTTTPVAATTTTPVAAATTPVAAATTPVADTATTPVAAATTTTAAATTPVADTAAATTPVADTAAATTPVADTAAATAAAAATTTPAATPETTTAETTTAENTPITTDAAATTSTTAGDGYNLPAGESFVSELTMISQVVVAPSTIAATTITYNSETSDTNVQLQLTTSNGKAMIATLTVGQNKDTDVGNTRNDPATVSVTRSDYTRTTLSTITTSSSSTSTSTSTSTTSTSTSTSTSTGTLNGVPKAIVYSPYTNSGGCKAYSDVYTDLTLIQSKGVQEIRVYGTDCNYMVTVLPIASKLGLKVNQGFWISSAGADSIDDAVSDFIGYTTSSAAGYDWDLFSFITIGNEAIISDYCSVDDLISKIAEVKGKLTSAGYSGRVTTSEPPVSFENNPSLCTASEIDFVGINPHSYFDKYSTAETAGEFIAGQISIVKEVCGDLDIFVTETGYPHAGIVNGGNVPTPENQLIALQSIFDVVGTDITILTTYDDYWKQPGEYGIEQSFGMITLLN